MNRSGDDRSRRGTIDVRHWQSTQVTGNTTQVVAEFSDYIMPVARVGNYTVKLATRSCALAVERGVVGDHTGSPCHHHGKETGKKVHNGLLF